MNVVEDVYEDGENNSADELAAPCKPDKGRGGARMQAKLITAAQSGKLRHWTMAVLSFCLNVLGVKVPCGSNRTQARDIAMQHVLPLLAQWDAFVPNSHRVMRSKVPPSSSQPCYSQPVDDVDGFIDEWDGGALMRACAYLHVFCHCTFFSVVVFQGVSPLVPIDFWWLLKFPIFRAPTFPPFSPICF